MGLSDYQVALACGRLHIRTEREELPLGDLLDFASRQNPRRGFLFVSRVLGKHIPCPPGRMRDTYQRLAAQVGEVPGPILAIGMAETATGLGAGVADSLAHKRQRTDVIFQHTTRHRIDAPALLRFDEVHSHAPEHILYAPDCSIEHGYRNARTLLLIDDEITTGRTLSRLAKGLRTHLPALEEVIFVSLIDWLGEAGRSAILRDIGGAVRFVSLIAGTFSFMRAADFSPTLPARLPAMTTGPRSARTDTGRRALALPVPRDILTDAARRLAATIDGSRPPVTVVGTGELAYPPFLLAEELERLGFDVLFQSTTRSPILPGAAIGESLDFPDEYGEGIPNYLHNPPAPCRYSVIAYESREQAASHALPRRLQGTVWVLPEQALDAPRPP